MFKSIGNDLYRPVTPPTAVQSEAGATAGPVSSAVSSVSNIAVTMTRHQLPEGCGIDWHGHDLTFFRNFKQPDIDKLFTNNKWNTSAHGEGPYNQEISILASYKNATLNIKHDSSTDQYFVYAYPAIDTKINTFNSLDDVCTFMEQREDAVA